MTIAGTGSEDGGHIGPFTPLRHAVFRRIWSASILSNFGQLIQSVGAAWAMTQMTGRADMVALVQTAIFAPMMLFSLVAGAIADSYDRRKIALLALLISFFGAAALSFVTLFGLLTPALLLTFCFVVGTGMTLLGPAWQGSVREQVPQREMPQAIGLNAISYNIARSFGPAVGGFLVALTGVISAFVVNALSYLPQIIVMFLWKREPEPSRLPPEGLGRAVISGIRYAFHSPAMRSVWMRTLIVAFIGSSTTALMPLITHDLLHGDAGLFGILLGCVGGGAVVGALLLSRIRQALSDEIALRLCLCIVGPCWAGVGLSHSPLLTGLLLTIGGAAWMVISALFNISIQLSAPRWVVGRALAGFITAICAGFALGGAFWGHIAMESGTQTALVASGIALVVSVLLGFIWRMPLIEEQVERTTPPSDVQTSLELTGRSGPIILSIEYRVPVDRARSFYRAMQDIESIRHRTGGYGWSLARDIVDPELWTERYHTPTWHDYLRQRDRQTSADVAAWESVIAFHCGDEPIRISRKLERPFGSVRWDADAPDRGTTIPLPAEGT